MKILGVIAEYNPFHKGHLYHIEKSKEKALNKANKEITRNLRKVTNSAMSSIGRQIGNAIMRGILGTKK